MWQDKLVGFLQVASIVSAAVFAAFALFTDFKKDGRITRHGRIAVIGIVLSAIFSLGTQWGKTEIDRLKGIDKDHRDEVDRTAELDRYREQLNRFAGLSDSQRLVLDRSQDLARRMRLSLRQQDLLQSQIRGTLSEVRALRSQDSKNTLRVLRGMWDEANRIDGARIELLVSATCNTSHGETSPSLFGNGDALVMLLTDDEARARAQGTLGMEAFSIADRTLISFRSESIEHAEVLGAGPLTRFYAFLSLHPESIASPDIWRVGHVGFELHGAPPASLDIGGLEAEAVLQPNPVPSFLSDVKNLPCTVEATLLANGRVVAESSGPLKMTRGDGGRIQLSASLPARPVDATTLPIFDAN